MNKTRLVWLLDNATKEELLSELKFLVGKTVTLEGSVFKEPLITGVQEYKGEVVVTITENREAMNVTSDVFAKHFVTVK